MECVSGTVAPDQTETDRSMMFMAAKPATAVARRSLDISGSVVDRAASGEAMPDSQFRLAPPRAVDRFSTARHFTETRCAVRLTRAGARHRVAAGSFDAGDAGCATYPGYREIRLEDAVTEVAAGKRNSRADQLPAAEPAECRPLPASAQQLIDLTSGRAAAL